MPHAICGWCCDDEFESQTMAFSMVNTGCDALFDIRCHSRYLAANGWTVAKVSNTFVTSAGSSFRLERTIVGNCEQRQPRRKNELLVKWHETRFEITEYTISYPLLVVFATLTTSEIRFDHNHHRKVYQARYFANEWNWNRITHAGAHSPCSRWHSRERFYLFIFPSISGFGITHSYAKHK